MAGPKQQKAKPKKAQAQKKKAKPQNMNKKNVGKQLKLVRPRAQLGGCILEYCKLVENPYDARATACLPTDAAMTQPNSYLCVWARGTGATAVANLVPGYGFVMTAPFRGATNDNSVAAKYVYVTQSTFTMTAPAAFKYDATGVDAVQSNSTWTTASAGTSADTGVQFRIIATGLRIRYRGTVLNAGAVCYPIVKRDHSSLNTDTLATILKDPKVHSVPLGKNWVSIVTVPSEEQELQFHVYNSTDPNWSSLCMGIFVVAPDNTVACNFEYECFTHFETIGLPVQNYRDSTVDPVGAAAVINAIKRRGASPITHDTPWRLAQEAAREIDGMSGLVA